MRHKVYFEIFGKKIVVNVTSNSKSEATQIIKDKIIIHKVEQVISKQHQESKTTFENLLDIFNIKK